MNRRNLRTLLAPPVFPGDEANTLRAKLLNDALWANLALMALCVVAALAGRLPTMVIVVEAALSAATPLLLRWLHQGRVRLASIVLLATGFIVITVAIASLGTIRVPATGFYLALIVAAGILFDLGGMGLMIGLSSLAVAGLIVAENAGWLPRPNYAVTLTQWIATTALFACVGFWTFAALKTIRAALQRSERDIAERKRHETRLLLAMEAAHQAWFELDLRTGLFVTSAEYALLIGHEPATFSTTLANWLANAHPEDRPSLEVAFNRCVAGGQAFLAEYRRQTAAGGWLWIHSVGRVVEYDAAGQPLLLVGTHTDITERKRAEAALRESEDRYRWLVASSLDAVLLTLPDGRILSANAAACRMFGRSEEALQRLGRAEVADTTDPRLARAVEERARTGTFRGELTLIRANGEKFTGDVSTAIFRTMDGSMLTSMVIRDITVRNQLAADLAQREARFHAVFDHAPVGISFTTSQGVVLVNSEHARITGVPIAESGVPGVFARASHPEDYARQQAAAEKFHRGEVGHYAVEKRYLHPDGRVQWAELTSRFFIDPATGERWIVTILADLAQRKEAEAALRESERQFRRIIETMQDGYFRGSPDGRLMLASPSSARLFGYAAPEEMAGLDIGALYADPADRTAIRASLQKEGRILDHIVKARRKNGTTFWISLNANLITDDEGQVTGLAGFVRDVTTSRQAEVALRLSESKLRAILDHSHDAIGVHCNGVWEVCNPAAVRLFGASAPEDLIGTPIFKVIAPGERRRVGDYVRSRTAGTEAPAAYVTRGLRADGTEFDMDVTLSSFTLAGALHVIVILRDITERRRAENALQETQARLALAMDQAHLAYWEFDAATATFTFNDRFYALYGTTAAREGGYQMPPDVYVREFLPLEDQAWAGEAMVKHQAGETTDMQLEHRIRRRDGALRDILVRATLVRDATGRVVGTRGANQDITERKRAEVALRESEKKFRQLADSITDVFWITSPDFKVMHYVSPGYEQVWGRSVASLYAQPHQWSEAIFPEDQPRVAAVLAEAMGKKPRVAVEYRITRPDGSLRWIADQTFQVRDAAGNLIRLTGIARDITERIAQEQKLRELLAQTERDARTKGELLREVNHRVTNNLSAILGLFVSEHKSVEPAGRPAVQPVLDRLTQRIRGLLTAHRLLSDSMWEPIRVDKLARRVIDAALSADPDRREARITLPPATVEISPRQASSLALILNELTTNSIKHGRAPETPLALSLETGTDGAFVTLCYRDNGPGFPADVIAGTRANVGLQLIRQLVTESLRGDLTLANDAGAIVRMRLRVEEPHRT